MRVFELDNDRNSILCSTHSFFISPDSRIYTLVKRVGSIFMKTEARTLFSISLLRRGKGDSSTIGNSRKWQKVLAAACRMTEIIAFGSS